MRNEHAMLGLILEIATEDARIRAAIMSGSRANPDARRDLFQDFDIVYLVTDIASFEENVGWVDRFGPRVMMQLPDAMDDPPPTGSGRFAYLMQFTDGNRIDLTLLAVDRVDDLRNSRESVLLLDKDGIVGPLAAPHPGAHAPHPPTAKAFADCCNEFWWVCLSVGKGLWRREIVHAKHLLDRHLREQLMKMLAWHLGVTAGFSPSAGTFGRRLDRDLDPALWTELLQTYSDADHEHTWDALEAMGGLFRRAAVPVAEQFGYEYPERDDDNVRAHLRRVRSLPVRASSF